MKLKVALMALALGGTLALAQAKPLPMPAKAAAQNPAPATLVGCLEGTPGQFLLIDYSGRLYNLVGDDSQLGLALHAEIEVQGTLPNPNGSIVLAESQSGKKDYVSESSTDAGTNNSGAGVSTKGNKVVNVTSAKIVAPDCDNFN